MRSCRKFAFTLALAAAGVLSVASGSRAQVSPVGGAGFGGNAGAASNQSTFSNPAYRGSQQDYPAAEVQTVPIAKARAATARAEQDQLMNDLHGTVDRLWEDFNYSPEMTAAVHEQNDAYFQFDDARRHALETLYTDPTYRAMVSLVSTLKTKLEDERPTSSKPRPEDMERVLATATLKLSYASSATAMEAAAMAADERVQQTRARLVAAGQKAGQLRADFERQIHRSPEFVSARRNFDDSRIARITADAFLDGAIDARDYALNYAYYIHRFDQYSYSPALLGSTLYYGAGNGFYGR